MNIFLYTIIFIMGTFFGSFFTLAVHRIPRREDITHTHSYCPNCNHKLGILELIPIFSYIFLGGKCKNCKQKIRIRYLVLEVLSGIAFVILAYILKINAYNIKISSLITFAFLALYFVAIFIIAGIDKEKRNIEKGVLFYALGVAIFYMIYLCIIDNTSIYRYAMYLAVIAILLVVDNIFLRKKAKNEYWLSISILLMIMAIFTGEYITINSCIVTLLAVAIYLLINKIKNARNRSLKKDDIYNENISLGFYLCLTNTIIFFIIASYITF